MKKIIIILLFVCMGCASKQVGDLNSLDYEQLALGINQNLKQEHFEFYHDHNPPRLKISMQINETLLMQVYIPPATIVYRLKVQPDGRFTYKLRKGGPASYVEICKNKLSKLRVEPAWLAQLNQAALIDLAFNFGVETQ